MNAWGKCSPRCSPIGNLRLLQLSFLKAAANLRKKVETAKNPVPTYIGTKSKHPTPILAVWTISATFAPC